MKIVFPEFIDVLPNKYLQKIGELCDLKWYDDFPTDPNVIVARSSDAEILVVKWIKFPEEIIDKCKNLKYIITCSVGFSHLPLEKARQNNIRVINCPTHNSQAVAEHVFALMFAVSRKVVESQSDIRKGEWKVSPYSFIGSELSGKNLGLIGHGNISKKIEEIAKGIGMNVTYVDSKSTDKDIDDLIRKSDYVSLNVPLTERTKLMFDKRRIFLMKPTACLINTARGELVDQTALLIALNDNKIAGAGLDVFQNTSATGKAPEEAVNLANLSNVVATAHIGFNTIEAGVRMGEELLTNIKAILEDRPINVVN